MKIDEKKKTWRNSTKHPNLEKKFTLQRRQEFLDTDYVKGTINSDGEVVIRKLTRDERDWLNQFYKETLNTNFNKYDSFYPINGIDKLTSKDLKKIREEFLNADKTINIALLEYIPIVKYIANKYDIPYETVINLVKRKEIYDANNALNSDLIKNFMRSSCDKYNEDLEEDYYYPLDCLNEFNDTIEDSMNRYLDYKHRKAMGWPDLNEE